MKQKLRGESKRVPSAIKKESDRALSHSPFVQNCKIEFETNCVYFVITVLESTPKFLS